MLGCGYKALRCRFALWGMALGIYKRQLYWAGQHMGCDPVRCRWCEWAVSAMHMCGLSRPRAPPSSTSPPVFFPKTYIYETEYAGEGSSHCGFAAGDLVCTAARTVACWPCSGRVECGSVLRVCWCGGETLVGQVCCVTHQGATCVCSLMEAAQCSVYAAAAQPQSHCAGTAPLPPSTILLPSSPPQS